MFSLAAPRGWSWWAPWARTCSRCCWACCQRRWTRALLRLRRDTLAAAAALRRLAAAVAQAQHAAAEAQLRLVAAEAQSTASGAFASRESHTDEGAFRSWEGAPAVRPVVPHRRTASLRPGPQGWGPDAPLGAGWHSRHSSEHYSGDSGALGRVRSRRGTHSRHGSLAR